MDKYRGVHRVQGYRKEGSMAQEKKKTNVQAKEEKGESSKKPREQKTTNTTSKKKTTSTERKPESKAHTVAKEEAKKEVEKSVPKKPIEEKKITKSEPSEKTSVKEKEKVQEKEKEKTKEKDIIIVEDDDENSSGGKIVIALLIIVILAMLIIRACNGNAKEYNIQFNTEGGSKVSSLKVESNGKIKRPEDPVKEGYTFEGWYYNGELFDFNTKVTKDIKLTAKWKKIESGTEAVSGVTIEPSSVTLAPGASALLEAIVTPENAKDKSVTWSSSDKSIVTVDSKGNIKAIKEGTATITVTTKDGNKKASIKVTVSKDAVAVTGITVKDKSLSLSTGDTYRVEATVSPNNATNKNVIWQSSNTNVVTVNSNGVVTAKGAGSATVTVTTSDGGYQETITVTVKDVPVKSVSISGPKEVSQYSSIQLKANFNPTNATNKSVTWSSSDNSVATVDKNGVVRGLKQGDVTITVTTRDGNKKATYKVTVIREEQGPTSVSIGGKHEVYVGEKITLTATVKPVSVKDKSVTWSSSNDSIATVDKNGVVTGVKAGVVTITATAKNGKTATYKVTVKEEEYVVTVTKLENKITHVIMQAEVTITKDGKAFTGWKEVVFVGGPKVAQDHYLGSLTTKFEKADILLVDGKTHKTATVRYAETNKLVD